MTTPDPFYLAETITPGQLASDLSLIAGLIAEAIRRMGASYGRADEWRYAITKLVEIEQRYHRAKIVNASAPKEAKP